MRGLRDSAGSAAAFELVALAAVLIIGLMALVTLDPGVAGGERVAQDLDSYAADALATLDAHPARSDAYASRLEELVTLAVAGNPAPLEGAIETLLPPGASFEVELDNLGGGRLHVAGEHAEDAPVSRSVPLSPRWSYFIVRPDVEEHAGATALDVLTLRGVLVRLSYVDTYTDVSVVLANGATLTLPAGADVRASTPTGPERASALGTVAGYAVPYDTSSLLAWTADVADLAEPVASFGADYEPSLRGPASLYRVHPSHTAAAEISQTLVDTQQGVTFGTTTGATDFRAGDTVVFEYDAGDVPGVIVGGATLRIWSPIGVEIAEDTRTASGGRLSGSYSYAIPKATLWGTHVAELEVTLTAPLDVTETYLAHRLFAFHVNPHAGFDSGVAHVPPLYEVSLHAWYPDFP